MSDLSDADRLADHVFGEATAGSHMEQLAMALQSIIPVVQQLVYTVESLTTRFDELAEQFRVCNEKINGSDR